MVSRLRTVVLTAALGGAAVLPAGTAWAGPAADLLPVQHSGVVTRQDIASQPGSEPDTVVEPDVAVDPAHPDVAIAVAHDSRFPDSGAVDITVAWTADGGGTWHHRPVPGVTTAVGGAYDRASDPVVAFGPDGTAYMSVLAFDTAPCPNQPSAVLVLTSGDGGRTWSRPHMAHQSATCAFSDDKNWLVVDTSPKSPHFGRVYQFWTPFFSDAAGNFLGARQAVRWSDDQARTWSATSYITPVNHATQNSQPMITASGAVVDTYYDYGVAAVAPEAAPAGGVATGARRDSGLAPRIVDNRGNIFASRSDDGGKTWRRIAEVAANGGGFAPGVRCCLFAASIDRATGIMYVAFEGAGLGNTDPVFLASSPDGGRLWTNPVQVSQGDRPGVQRVNVDVVARGGSVYVTYGTRTNPQAAGGTVQQQLSISQNRGTTFGPPQSIGPVSVLRYAAQARGFFPGDYIGAAIAGDRLYVVFAQSSKPPASSSSPFHQVIWGVTLRP
jgi:hypothetical protein